MVEMKAAKPLYEPYWDYEVDGKVYKSCAVLAFDDAGNGVLLHACGPAIDWHIEQYSSCCEELDLLHPDEEPGIWVWEGTMGSVLSRTFEGDEWVFEARGEWRQPTDEEWEAIKANRCPWDKSNLPRKKQDSGIVKPQVPTPGQDAS